MLSRFEHFDYGHQINSYGMIELSKLFSIEQEKFIDILIEIIPEKINSLNSAVIFNLVSLIKGKLKPIENEELITWILNKWNVKIGYAQTVKTLYYL